jgi:Na+/H+ antiporter NhaC
VSLATQLKHVVWKQLDAGMYGAPAYVVSVVCVGAPIAAVDVMLFGTIVYWMAGVRNERTNEHAQHTTQWAPQQRCGYGTGCSDPSSHICIWLCSLFSPLLQLDPNAGSYFFFLLMLFLISIIIATVLRLVGFALTNAAVAGNLASPIIALLNIFGQLSRQHHEKPP